MRFWFDHSSEVTLHEQIVTQVRLGILAGELQPDARLPSIREIARRFDIHPNTVSAAYRELEREAWVTSRRGSGVYVRRASSTAPEGLDAIDSRIRDLVREAARLRVDPESLQVRFHRVLKESGRRELLLIEPDPELARIVAFELERLLGRPIEVCAAALQELDRLRPKPGSHILPLVLPSKAESVRKLLKHDCEPLVLRINSIAGQLAQHLPASRQALIGIASGWAPFLTLARTMLVAAGYSHEALVLRDTRQHGWRNGLDETDAVICDSVTSGRMKGHKRLLTYPLLANDATDPIREMLAQSVPRDSA